jgi:cold shock CspA family protein
MQGVIKSYNPKTQDGIIVDDRNLEEFELAPAALQGTIFRMLRPGQRLVFELDESRRASKIQIGSESDMATDELAD